MTYKLDIQFQSDKQIIALSDSHGLHFFELQNIIRCRSANSYTEFYIENRGDKIDEIVFVASKGFNDFEKFLPIKSPFFRVHNQHLVNIAYINKYVKDDGNYLILNDKKGTNIPIARNRRLLFLKYLKEHGITF